MPCSPGLCLPLPYKMRFWLIMVSFALPIHVMSQNVSLRFSRLGPDQGFSQNRPAGLVQDSEGQIWSGSQDGLNRYDGSRITIFNHDPTDPSSLSGQNVQNLHVDLEGRLWVASSGGLDRYDPYTESFEHVLSKEQIGFVNDMASWGPYLWIASAQRGLIRLNPANLEIYNYTYNQEEPGKDGSLISSNIRTVSVIRDQIWVGGSRGFGILNAETNRFENHIKERTRNPDDNLYIRDILEDSHGRIWMASKDLILYDGEIKKFPHPDRLSPRFYINALVEDSKGTLWLGSSEGCDRFDPETGTFESIRHDPSNPHSLAPGAILWMIIDSSNVLWLTTEDDGLNRLPLENLKFRNYRHQGSGPNTLIDNRVRATLVDRKQNLWVGTVEGIGHLDMNTGKWSQLGYNETELDSNLLMGGRLLTLAEDHTGHIWIGYYWKGISRLDPKTGKFRHYPRGRNGKFPGTPVYDIHEDRAGRLWIGTGHRGLVRLDRATDQLIYFSHDPNNTHSPSENYLIKIFEDRQGMLWLGYFNRGFDRYDPSHGQFTHYLPEPDNPASIQAGAVLAFYEDDEGVLWIGSTAGLERMRPDGSGFDHFGKKDGLPNQVIYDIVPDKLGNLWMSTNAGIVRFNPEKRIMRAFDINDGITYNEFNNATASTFADGTMVFGSSKGLTMFNPAEIQPEARGPKVKLTEFFLYNKPVKPELDGVLTQSIGTTKSIVLDYHEEIFGFEFSALHYRKPGGNRYQYRLEGFDQQWIHTNARRPFATYTDLPANDYTFRVKAATPDAVWGEEVRLNIRVLSPPWKQWWAYLIYVACGLSIVGLWVRAQQRKLAYERSVVERLRQVDQLKDELMANTSHELRTPLNGIIGLAQSLQAGVAGQLPEPAIANLGLIVSSGRRLSHLVNDILDFARLREQRIKLSRGPVLLRELCDEVIALSEPLIGDKPLVLVNGIDATLPPVDADRNRLEQVFHNLVGNAIKFTPKGRICVSAEREDEFIRVQVQDTGIGIPEEHLERIFNHFEQADGSMERVSGGTGLGLAITRQLLSLHGSEIEVISQMDKGSTFQFRLEQYRGEQDVPVVDEPFIAEPVTQPEALANHDFESATGPRIMVVDDDPVNRQVLVNHLAPKNYRLQLASDGFECLEQIKEELPDLVLLDVMMPRMSGYEVCRRIREDHGPSELPILFLTARGRSPDQLACYAAGGNDFLSKPVEVEILNARLEIHLKLRALNRELENLVEQRTAQLERSQAELLDEAHEAGMAMVARGVIHNLGNALNSIKTSSQLLQETASDRQWLQLLERLSQALEENRTDLSLSMDEVISRDKLPHALGQLYERFLRQFGQFTDESGRLIKRVDKIIEMIKDQEEQTRQHCQTSPFDLNELLEEGLSMQSGLLSRNKIKIVKHFNHLEPVQLNRPVFMRILFCILKNALEAIQESKQAGQIEITTLQHQQRVELIIKDNGVGIEKSLIGRVCGQGFTTKLESLGMGLHYCAYSLHEIGANLEICSQGLGQGTSVTISFPSS